MRRGSEDAAIRRYTVMSFVNALGTGTFYPVALLFYVETTGLSLSYVGTAATVAGLAVLPALVPAGRFVKTFGAARSYILTCALRAGAFALYLLGLDTATFVVITSVALLCNRVQAVAGAAIKREVADASAMSRWVSLSKSTFSAGVGLGSLIAALLVDFGHTGYLLIGVINAVSFALAGAVCLTFLGAVQHKVAKPTEADSGDRVEPKRGRPWRDRGFVVASATSALYFALGVSIEAAIPLVALVALDAPSAIVAVVFGINAGMVTFLQRSVGALAEAMRPNRAAVLGLVFYVPTIAVVGLLPAASDVVVLIVFALTAVLMTLGEIIIGQVMGSAMLLIPPAEEIAPYTAVNQIMMGLTSALSPVFLGATLPDLRWLCALVLFVGMGLVAAGQAATLRELRRTSGLDVAGYR